MKGAEFIGICDGESSFNKDSVMGIILYQQGEDPGNMENKLLFIFDLGDSIWKRPGRQKILEKILLRLNNDIIIQRSQRIRFRVTKILRRGIQVDELENKIKHYKEYQRWKETL